jgi:hypothetical protein
MDPLVLTDSELGIVPGVEVRDLNLWMVAQDAHNRVGRTGAAVGVVR